jgi:shikimate dehydrogenase
MINHHKDTEGPELSPVHTLADLAAWSSPGTALAVLGHPIRHSLSPAMHNAALADIAREQADFAGWRYHRFDISPEDLPRALALFHQRGFRGLNLTVPHKVVAFGQMNSVAPVARLIGAVNTLLRTAAPGGWEGRNTDGYGLATAVRESLGIDLAGAAVILLGAGGAARAAAVECLQRRCASLWIANRTLAHLQALLGLLQPLGAGVPVRGFDPESSPAGLPHSALVINATSAGLRTEDLPPIDLARLPRPAGVFDMIYNPPQTPLLRQAAALGVPQANGLAMLVHQGAKSLEYWSGVPAERTAPVMMRAARAALFLS